MFESIRTPLIFIYYSVIFFLSLNMLEGYEGITFYEVLSSAPLTLAFFISGLILMNFIFVNNLTFTKMFSNPMILFLTYSVNIIFVEGYKNENNIPIERIRSFISIENYNEIISFFNEENIFLLILAFIVVQNFKSNKTEGVNCNIASSQGTANKKAIPIQKEDETFLNLDIVDGVLINTASNRANIYEAAGIVLVSSPAFKNMNKKLTESIRKKKAFPGLLFSFYEKESIKTKNYFLWSILLMEVQEASLSEILGADITSFDNMVKKEEAIKKYNMMSKENVLSLEQIDSIKKDAKEIVSNNREYILLIAERLLRMRYYRNHSNNDDKEIANVFSKNKIDIDFIY